MSKSIVLSVNGLLNRALMSLKLTSIDQVDSALTGSRDQKNHQTVKEKILGYKSLTSYHPHTLHHVMKSLGHLPTPLLERLITQLKGPTAEQYPHANAHLRLILAVNRKLKIPLDRSPMHELRERFAADAVAMQAPKVWKQTGNNIIRHIKLSNIKRFTKRDETTIHWEDAVIANADDGDMTIRCYQACVSTKKISFKKRRTANPDETVMLFFHGGGFCIGNIDTHHEFCHAICTRTGWSVVSVDYRLAPEHPTPAALRDCIAAYAWLAEHCHTLNALPSRIVLAGDSAGGGLSTLLAQQLTASTVHDWLNLDIDGQTMFDLLQDLPKPLAQMPIYPVTDVETNYPSWELYGDGLLLDHADVAVFGDACFKNSLLPRQHILNAPILGDNRKVCATYIVAAELDVLRDQALAYAKQLQNHGVLVETYKVLGAPHGFIHLMSVHEGLGQETSNIIDSFARFVHDLMISDDTQLAA